MWFPPWGIIIELALSRLDHRRGIAEIRTASELAVILPVPLLMVISGYAAPVFPNSTPSSPSPFVRIMNTRLRRSFPAVTHIPLDVHWTQWESVCVPLLEDRRLSDWRGQVDLLCAVTLSNAIVGPGGVVISGGEAGTEIGFSLFCTESVGHLFSCDPSDLARATGKTSQFLDLFTRMIYTTADSAGF